MRATIILLGALGFMAANVWADEQLAQLKVSDTVYHNVTVTRVTGDQIFFVSNEGMGNVKLKDLDAETEKHFRLSAGATGGPRPDSTHPTARYHFRVADPTNAAPSAPADVKQELADAMSRVREIVNQPITHLRRTPDMAVSLYNQGWFHPGAIRPDFNTVDIRQTRELNYAKQSIYVTSDLNPGEVFDGRELEFNSMTKYFYTDRSVPKKKLTEVEMIEINRLYRIIGKDEAELSGQSSP